MHGWDFKPSFAWYPWLRRELERSGFEAHTLEMPNASTPKIDEWTGHLKKEVGNVDNDTYFIGHSIACQTIMRFLETIDAEIGGAIFVAGFFKRLTNLEDDPEVRNTARLWLESPVDFKKARSHLSKSVAIFSDNDPFVPLDNHDDFRDKLGSEIIIQHAKGHFSGSQDKTFELPIARDKLFSLLK